MAKLVNPENISDVLSDEKKKLYIVNQDIRICAYNWITSNRQFGTNQKFYLPERVFYDSLEDEIIEHFLDFFPDNVYILPFSFHQLTTDFGQLINSKIKSLRDEYSSFLIVSIDDVLIPKYFVDYFLQINRIAKFDEEINSFSDIGIGSRPRHSSLYEQISRIQSNSCRNIVLVDDGTWTKATLYKTEQLFKKLGFNILMYIVAIEVIDNEASYKLEKPVYSLQKLTKSNILDWVSTRDFIVGLPHCGRTAGEVYEYNARSPLELLYNAVPTGIGNLSFPYISLLGEPTKWASIPVENEIEFSIACLALSVRHYNEVAKTTKNVKHENNTKILLEDVARPPFYFRNLVNAPKPYTIQELCEKTVSILSKK